jgi:predicted regulator of Ras-like GTPase activity (Roadblock/LC7/MglB family)
MADSTQTPDRESAARALSALSEMTPDMRGGAILSADGKVLASSGEAREWAEAGTALLAAADAAGPPPVEQVHVATEDGEVFALRTAGLAAVVVTDRFVLASLMAFDMRAALRDLSAEAAATVGA